MKKIIEGNELLYNVPAYNASGRKPIVRLQNNLVLDDGNCFESPTLILGNVGTGKTSMMIDIINPILQYCDQSGDNVVFFCPKPDMLRYRRNNDPLISIKSRESASCWNIFAEMRASDDPELTLREISTELFADAEEKTTQIFFPQAARDIFYQSCRYMYDYSLENGIMFSNAELVNFLETTPIESIADTLGWIELSIKYPAYFGMIRDYIGNGSDQGLGCLSELRTLISRTLFGSFAAKDGRFSALESLTGERGRIFLYYDYANSGHSTLSVFHIISDLLLKQAMRTDAKKKTWFFYDEGSLLPKSNVLMDSLSFGRDPGSNGRGGVRIIMAMQSARLMTHHYSKEEAETLLSLFPNVIALRVSDPMSRSIVSDRYGKAHYQYSYAGIGDKIHYHDSIEDVVSDYHFSQITKKGQAIISMPGLNTHPFFYDGFIAGR